MLIENFGTVKQKRNNTCGYATAGMILTFLEGQSSINEDYLIENDPFDAIGITFKKLMEVYQKYLKKYKAEIVYGDREKMLEIIKSSLKDNIPLHIQYLTENLMGQKELVLHYSALIGYNEASDCFVIADPYDMVKTIEKEDFFSAISFRNECLPEIVKQKYPSNMMIKFSSC
jgi:hypothetical protein